MYRKILGISLLLLLVSCTPHITPAAQQYHQEKLYTLLIHMDKNIDLSEARLLASEAIRYSQQLASQYEVSTPPLMHNFLINIGVKQRGLCYQWSDDLYRHLKKFHFKSIHLRPVGAHIGSYWREDNALVALPTRSKDLSSGILLDAWRGSGLLYYIPIDKDPKYRWDIRTDRCDIYQSGR